MWRQIKEIIARLMNVALVATIGVTLVWGVIFFLPSAAVKSPDILGPHNVMAGDLVVLATESPTDEQQPAYSWTVVPDLAQTRTMENGKQIVLVFPQPGEYVIVLATAAGGKVKQSTHRVNVSGDGPAPGPGPRPEPAPAPDPEPDLSEWAQWVKDLAIRTVPAADRPKQAALVAGQFRAVASMIAAGAITTQREARTELRVANNKALGKAAIEWVDFSTEFAGYLAKLAVNGELKTLDQYQKIYQAAADGLDTVAVTKGETTSFIDILSNTKPDCANGRCYAN